jgi:hypothetical protein
MSDATFMAYIDESGDEGFRFGEGSSEWFILAAVVIRTNAELAQVKLIDEVRDRINQERLPAHRMPPKKPIHFRDLKHEPRKFYAARVGQADLKTMAVMIHKSALASPENFTEETRLYFYAVRLLVERISWYCRDHRRKDDPGDGSACLVFSNRAGMDYEALKNYLVHLHDNRVALKYQAALNIIRPTQFETYTHGRRMGLQLADAVASSYYYAVWKNAYGFTEDSYARLLLPRAYRHQGKLWGYGVKILPREADEQRRNGVILPGWEA